ncbi:MAG: hypothetical protein ACYC65_03350 [Candidatus Limnocylindrales bacterium]
MSRHQNDARSQVVPRDPSARRRSGPRIGPVRITPVRVTLLIALLGGIGFLAWSVLVRDQLQVPLMATGLAICGLVFAATAVLSVAAVVRAGREGRDGAAVLTALVGGLFAMAALMSLAGAVIMSLIWGGTPGA